MRRPEAPIAAVIAVLSAPSCAPAGEPVTCGATAQPLVGAVEDEAFLGVSVERARAVVRVGPALRTADYFCTGVLVAPSWVLTARHCDRTGRMALEARDTDGAKSLVEAARIVRHPDLDVLLLELDAPQEIAPIGVMRAAIGAAWVGLPVQLAGFGTDAGGIPAESVKWLVEVVAAVSETELVVDGLGHTGACIGDSGGPLLVREPNGVLAAAGVLSRGSGDCVGRDAYVRSDVIAEWVAEITGPLIERSESCGGVTTKGMCRGGSAIWCDEGVARGEACGGETRCGYSAAAVGYRCVPHDDDTCDGVDDLGICNSRGATRCDDGRVVSEECSGCSRCGRDVSSGHAACLPP